MIDYSFIEDMTTKTPLQLINLFQKYLYGAGEMNYQANYKTSNDYFERAMWIKLKLMNLLEDAEEDRKERIR